MRATISRLVYFQHLSTAIVPLLPTGADASAPHLTHYGAYNRMTVWQPPDHPLVPWTGTMFEYMMPA